MAPKLRFFDMSVQVTPPGGYLEPLPITLGPNWQPNDIRLAFITGSGLSGNTALEMLMHPNPPTGFTAAYSLNPTYETHGVWYRRLVAGDSDNVSVAWDKPSSWLHFMFCIMTVRGASPTANPTGGWLKINQIAGATTATAQSVTVPGAGTMVLLAGTIPNPYAGSNVPAWAVSMGAPTGWTNLVATDKSGINFYPYDNNPSLTAVAKSYTSSGTTGSVAFSTSIGEPAFMGLYVFCPSATDPSATLTPA